MSATDTTRVTPLSPDKVNMAFPLIKSAIPDVNLEDWENFAALYLSDQSPERGILTIEDERGYYFGLFTYTVRQQLGVGRILVIENLIAADLYGRDMILEKLLDAQAELESLLECKACDIYLPGQFEVPHSIHCSLADSLLDHGFCATAVRLRHENLALADRVRITAREKAPTA